MSEYFVAFKATIGSLLSMTGSEIYEADTAKEAMEKARLDFRTHLIAEGGDEEDAELTITEVRKV